MCMPDVGSLRNGPADAELRRAYMQPLQFSRQQVLQHHLIKRQIRHQALEARVLLFDVTHLRNSLVVSSPCFFFET
jgi:hypothetical protein